MPRLFVHNFRFDATEEVLIDFFRTFGEVTRVSITKDKDTGRSRGFGFVDIDPLPQFVDCLVEETNGLKLGGRTLNIELARDKHRNGGGGSAPAKPAKRHKGQRRRERDGEDWD